MLCARSLAEKTRRAALTPPPDLKMWEWCDQNLILSTRQATAFPGPYRSELTPYVRGIMDALRDPAVRTVVVQKGAQTGLTMLAYAAICYWISNDPGPVIIVMPSADLARSASEARLQPLIRDSPEPAKEISAKLDEFKKMEYRLRRCSVNWVGSNRAANLASRPSRYLVLDETDKYPIELGEEANPIDLARQRTKAFWNRKILIMSTPTTENGYICRNAAMGDMREYQVPCPKCKHMQALRWAAVKWPKDCDPEEAGQGAHFHCTKCDAPWTDDERIQAVERGQWVATQKARVPGTASFKLPSFCSRWTQLADLVPRWIKAQDVSNELHDIINSEFAEPWKPETRHVDETNLENLIEPYRCGELQAPEGSSSIVLLSVDVQKVGEWVEVRQWLIGGDSWLIDYKFVHGWEVILKLADQYDAHQVYVDAGYGERTQEVYEACLEYNFIPTKGASGKMDMTWRKSDINPYEGTRKQKEGASLPLVLIDTDAYKFQLLERLNGKSSFRWAVPENMPPEYGHQVVAEEYIETRGKGKFQMRRGWRDNHATDTSVMQLVAATIYGYNSAIMPETKGETPAD